MAHMSKGLHDGNDDVRRFCREPLARFPSNKPPFNLVSRVILIIKGVGCSLYGEVVYCLLRPLSRSRI